MNDGGTTAVSPDEATTEGTSHPHVDDVLANWICVGALAWEGYLTRGRGYVLLTEDDHRVVPSYEAGSPCECCPIDDTTYDPETQAVIVRRRDDAQFGPFVVTGTPPPPEALARARADVMGGTVH